MKIEYEEKEKETEQEFKIIKYALTFLLSNLDDDVIKDMSDFVGTNDADEIESKLQEIIDTY